MKCQNNVFFRKKNVQKGFKAFNYHLNRARHLYVIAQTVYNYGNYGNYGKTSNNVIFW